MRVMSRSSNPSARRVVHDVASPREAGALAEADDPREIIRSALGGEAGEQRNSLVPSPTESRRRMRTSWLQRTTDSAASRPPVPACPWRGDRPPRRRPPNGVLARRSADAACRPRRRATAARQPRRGALAKARHKPSAASPLSPASTLHARSPQHPPWLERLPPRPVMHFYGTGAAGRRRKLTCRLPCRNPRRLGRARQ